MNHLIITLSKINETIGPERFSDIVYVTDGGESFSGRQTNEACSKYLIQTLARQSELFDRIIVLVSEECVSVPIPAVGGMTTYDYYKTAMKTYLRETIKENAALQSRIDEACGGSAESYFDMLFSPVGTDGNLLKSIVDLICGSENATKDSLYLDLTGGSRVTSLVSLLLARILESTHAEVKQIVYGDILKGSAAARIRDCTRQYDLLTTIENIAKAQTFTGERNRRIVEELRRIGLLEGDGGETAQTLDDIEKAADALKRVPEPEAETAKKRLETLGEARSGLEKRLIAESAEALVRSREITGYTKLLSRPANELIVEFYESFFDLLIDGNILVSPNGSARKEDIKKALNANYAYYYGEVNAKGKRVKTGLLETVKSWCGMLYRNADAGRTWISPEESYRRCSSILDRYYEKWRAPYYPKRINSDKVNEFLAYIEENAPFNGAPLNSFLEMSRLQTLYYNYGYPFMCCGKGNDDASYPDIFQYYRDAVSAFFASLEKQKRDSFDRYRKTLHYYANREGALEDAIPYMLKMKAWTVNPAVFREDREGEAFVRELCERLETVRPYRNAIAHKLSNDFSAPEKQRQMAQEIQNWIRAYEKRFTV